MKNTFSDPEHLKHEQYKTADNLMARVGLYDRFLKGPSQQDVRLDQARFQAGESVIDFGAGNGLVWVRAQERGELPKDLTLVDLSQGMLDAAKDALGSAQVGLIQHDISQPLAVDCQYDTATAFHMLYHLSDPMSAMDEILRHIKRGGRALIHLNAPDHLAGMRQLINEFERKPVLADQFIAAPPSAQEAQDHWQETFSQCRRVECHSELHITDAEPLLGYILSIETMHGNRYTQPERLAEFSDFVQRKTAAACQADGALIIKGHSVLLEFSDKQ